MTLEQKGVLLKTARLIPILLLLTGVFTTRAALAGANRGASANLSWSPSDLVSDRSTLPPGEVALYLRLAGMVDVREIAVDLRWFPSSAGRACYTMVSAPTDSLCGNTINALPSGPFNGDTSYNWTIHLSSIPEAEVCVAYWFAHDSCEAAEPARFSIATLRLMDSAGNVDEIPILNEATILAGSGIPPRLAVHALGVPEITSGRDNTFHILGNGFQAGSSVRLMYGTSTLLGTSIDFESPSSLSATFQVPDTATGLASIAVTLPNATVSDTLRSSIAIQDTTTETGSGVNGYSWAIDKPTAGGVYRKYPGSSQWVFIPSAPDSTAAQFALAFEPAMPPDALMASAQAASHGPASPSAASAENYSRRRDGIPRWL